MGQPFFLVNKIKRTVFWWFVYLHIRVGIYVAIDQEAGLGTSQAAVTALAEFNGYTQELLAETPTHVPSRDADHPYTLYEHFAKISEGKVKDN